MIFKPFNTYLSVLLTLRVVYFGCKSGANGAIYCGLVQMVQKSARKKPFINHFNSLYHNLLRVNSLKVQEI
jgi:hypothetical protein